MEQKVQSNPRPPTTGQLSGTAIRPPVPVVNHSNQAQPGVLPSLDDMQASAHLQARVDQRITHLDGLPDINIQSSGKFRSQRGGKEVVFVKRQVPWPHNSVLTGNTRERVSYDDLDIYQWVAGYAGICKDESDVDLKNIMLEHLIALMEDAHDFSWIGSKAAHAVILTKMEDCKLEWDDSLKLERIRRQNQRAEPARGHAGPPSGKSKHMHSGKKICQYYQRKACHAKTAEHFAKGVCYRHICASCFAFGHELEHPARDCPELRKQSKNVNTPTLNE